MVRVEVRPMGVNREKERGKHMKRKWMVWPLVLGMVLLLAACGGGKQQESLVGSWTGQVDMMDQVVKGMSLTEPEIAQELEMEAFNLTLEMEFRDDNTYTMTVDQDKLDESIEELIQKTVDATLAHLEQELKDQGITSSIKTTELGYIQRGGAPTMQDRMLAAQFGVRAVDVLLEGKGSRVVGIKDNKIIDQDISEALAMERVFDKDLYDCAAILGQ